MIEINKKVILWDFDGVLMDSMPVRNQGFKMVLKEFPQEEVDLLMDYHLKNGGLSRYVKFRYFFEEIKKSKITDEEVNAWAQKFSEVMRKELIAAHLLIQDSLQYVKNNYERYNMHIVSGSDQEELRFICKSLNIDRYFSSINGSPTPKIELVENVLNNYNYSPNQTLLIGDSMNDYEAAVANGISFFGYNNTSLKGVGDFYIKTFNDL